MYAGDFAVSGNLFPVSIKKDNFSGDWQSPAKTRESLTSEPIFSSRYDRFKRGASWRDLPAELPAFLLLLFE